MLGHRLLLPHVLGLRKMLNKLYLSHTFLETQLHCLTPPISQVAAVVGVLVLVLLGNNYQYIIRWWTRQEKLQSKQPGLKWKEKSFHRITVLDAIVTNSKTRKLSPLKDMPHLKLYFLPGQLLLVIFLVNYRSLWQLWDPFSIESTKWSILRNFL